MARPVKIETAEELQAAFKDYIDGCDNATKEVLNNKGGLTTVPNPIIPTLGDFCYRLGITTETLRVWEERDGFSATVKNIKETILSRKEFHLLQGNGNTTGLIFDLKCNHGWKDKINIEHEGEVTITMNLNGNK
jgi:hypothetical protein